MKPPCYLGDPAFAPKIKTTHPPPKSTSSPKGGTDTPNDSGSPRGVLMVTRYNLRKGTQTSMCTGH